MALLLSGIPATSAAKNKQAEEDLKNAREAEIRQQWEVALDLYEKALLRDPGNAAYGIAAKACSFPGRDGARECGTEAAWPRKTRRRSFGISDRPYAIDPSSAIADQEFTRTKAMIDQEKTGVRTSTAEQRGLTPVEVEEKAAEARSARMLTVPELKPIKREISSLRMNYRETRGN